MSNCQTVLAADKKVCALLVECFQEGGDVFVNEQGVLRLSGANQLEDSLIDTLRQHRDAIADYFKRHGKRTDPAEVPFVAPDLGTLNMDATLVGRAQTLVLDGREYYRLTPDVFAKLTSKMGRSQEMIANPHWRYLRGYVERHYMPHEIAIAESYGGSFPKPSRYLLSC